MICTTVQHFLDLDLVRDEMKTLHLSIIAVFLGFTCLMLSYDNNAYGIWVRQSPQELLNDSSTIFVGNITSVNVLQFEKETSDIMTENGIEKNVVKNYTLSIDEYNVNIEEFLKNPQNVDKITVRQPITSWSPGMLGGLDEFHVGDRVLFYIKNLDGNNTYSPESFIIPKSCAATNVLTQNRLEARGESFTIQNGIKTDSNFTANKPIYFVDNEDVDTLSGKSFDILVNITKNTGSNPETVFSKEIHSQAKPCEWIAPAEWEFTPQEGYYRMDVTITEDNKTYAQYIEKFPVQSDVVTPDHISPLKQIDNGIPTENITCSSDLELIYKTSNKYPVCVKHSTAEKLVQRGWAIRGQPISYFVKTDGFLIPYDLVGGNMLGVKSDVQNKSVIFSVHTTSSGVLYVEIPRALLDSKSAYSNQDTKFIILVDKHEVKYTETTSITNRTLSIPLDSGAKEIEITATVGI